LEESVDAVLLDEEDLRRGEESERSRRSAWHLAPDDDEQMTLGTSSCLQKRYKA
jgi:hypothetical protein